MSELEQIFIGLKEEIDGLNFSETIRQSRTKIGLMQYRAAEHLKMTIGRLKNLETGYFRIMPSASEIRDLCNFYGLPQEEMILRAEAHVAERTKQKRTFHGRSNLQVLQKC